jgi:hypothetical protein
MVRAFVRAGKGILRPPRRGRAIRALLRRRRSWYRPGSRRRPEMTRASIACASLLLVLLTGCTKRIDSSSPESTSKSIEAIQQSLSEEQRKQFGEALAVVIPNALGGGYKDVGDSPDGRARVRAALAGKSADDIIAEAARIKQDAVNARSPR